FERDAERQMDLVWDALIAGAALSNSNIWNPRFQMVAQATRTRFGKCTARFVGHSAAPTLAVLLNRTVRGIAPSPLWLFGPECDVHMPFAHRSVIEAALAVPLTVKDQGSFYRALLEEAAPR